MIRVAISKYGMRICILTSNPGGGLHSRKVDLLALTVSFRVLPEAWV